MTRKRNDSIESDVGKLEAIHRAGISVIVDSAAWYREAKDLGKAQKSFPLNPAISASRVDAVTEGIRIAMMLDRPRVAPTGTEYRHSESDLRDAFHRITDYVLDQVKKSGLGKDVMKESGNDKPAEDTQLGDESRARDGVMDDSGGEDAEAKARGK